MKLFKKKREEDSPVTGDVEQTAVLSATASAADEEEVITVADEEETVWVGDDDEETLEVDADEEKVLEVDTDDEDSELEEEVELPEWLNGAVEFMDGLGLEVSVRKMPVELLALVAKGLEYDRAVAAALAEGELKGRNVKIAECFMKPDSDGLPHLGSQGSLKGVQSRTSSIFDLARGAIY